MAAPSVWRVDLKSRLKRCSFQLLFQENTVFLLHLDAGSMNYIECVLSNLRWSQDRKQDSSHGRHRVGRAAGERDLKNEQKEFLRRHLMQMWRRGRNRGASFQGEASAMSRRSRPAHTWRLLIMNALFWQVVRRTPASKAVPPFLPPTLSCWETRSPA